MSSGRCSMRCLLAGRTRASRQRVAAGTQARGEPDKRQSDQPGWVLRVDALAQGWAERFAAQRTGAVEGPVRLDVGIDLGAAQLADAHARQVDEAIRVTALAVHDGDGAV